MGDLLAADFKKKKYLGKVDTPPTEQEVTMAAIEREIAAALWGVPLMFIMPDVYVAPDKDPA